MAAESRHGKGSRAAGDDGAGDASGDDDFDAAASNPEADADDDGAPHYCDGDDDYLVNAPVDCIPRKTLGACEWCAITARSRPPTTKTTMSQRPSQMTTTTL